MRQKYIKKTEENYFTEKDNFWILKVYFLLYTRWYNGQKPQLQEIAIP